MLCTLSPESSKINSWPYVSCRPQSQPFPSTLYISCTYLSNMLDVIETEVYDVVRATLDTDYRC